MKKINIVFCSFPDYAGNAKPLYEYIKDNYPNSFNLYWVVKDEIVYRTLIENNINAYIYGSEEYFDLMKTADLIFTTHCNLISDKPKKAIYVELWHGVGLKPIGYLVKNMSEFDKDWYNHVKGKIDYMIVPSDFWRSLFSSMFRVLPERILDLGCPRLDEAIKHDANTNLEALLNIKIKDYQKIIFYTPTLSKNVDRELDAPLNTNNVFNFDTYDEQLLFNFLEENNYLLCIKLHPSEPNTFKKVNHKNIFYLDEQLLSSKNMNIYYILNSADILISDYSSLGIEFLYLKKPTIFLNNNVDTYIKNRGIIFNNINFWCSENSVNSLNELFEKIKITSKMDKKLMLKRELWFSSVENSCENICNYFFANNTISSNITNYIDPENSIKQKNKKLKEEIEKLNNENQLLLSNKNQEIEKLNNELELIVNSKGWKLLEKMRKFKRKIHL